MLLTLPWIAFLAAVFYLVAHEAGWFEGLARRIQNRRWRRPAKPKPISGQGERPADSPTSDRLRVFEEFLRHLPHEDGEDPP